jgi:hypothetical protein
MGGGKEERQKFTFNLTLMLGCLKCTDFLQNNSCCFGNEEPGQTLGLYAGLITVE